MDGPVDRGSTLQKKQAVMDVLWCQACEGATMAPANISRHDGEDSPSTSGPSTDPVLPRGNERRGRGESEFWLSLRTQRNVATEALKEVKARHGMKRNSWGFLTSTPDWKERPLDVHHGRGIATRRDRVGRCRESLLFIPPRVFHPLIWLLLLSCSLRSACEVETRKFTGRGTKSGNWYRGRNSRKTRHPLPFIMDYC